MNEDELIRRLREADADAAPPPAMPSDLAQRVWLRRERRRFRRRLAVGAGAAAAAIVAAGAWYLAPHLSTTEHPVVKRHEIADPSRISQDEIARMQAALQVLDVQAEAHEATADQVLAMVQRRRRVGTTRRLGRGGRLEEMRRQIDRAAYLTLWRAEMLLSETGNVRGAMEAYRQVVEMFPETPWADIARQRQSILRDKTGETL